MLEPEMYYGDCLDILARLQPHSFDAVVSDIPTGRTQLAWDQPIRFKDLWPAVKRVAKPNAAIVLLGATQPFAARLVMSNHRDYKYSWYWYQNMISGFQNARTQPLKAMEEICVFYEKQCTYNPQPMKSRIADRTFQDGAPNGDSSRDRNPHGLGVQPVKGIFREEVTPWNVLDIPCVPRATGTLHPTQKPVELMEFLVRTYTNPEERVLDFTAGSFSTGIACLNSYRAFTGIERGQVEFEIGRSRMIERMREIEFMLVKPWEMVSDPPSEAEVPKLL